MAAYWAKGASGAKGAEAAPAASAGAPAAPAAPAGAPKLKGVLKRSSFGSAGTPSPDRSIGGGGGALGACGVFDTYTDNNDELLDSDDFLTMPGGSTHGGSDCPGGAVLSPGDSVGWASNGYWQGNPGGSSDNGCGAKGLCGLPYSGSGLGGGWQICFAA